ncbi:MAG: hypothetical protein ABSD38_12210 [Syntrophorhabdales bacterium]|jgi:hypothetical protein
MGLHERYTLRKPDDAFRLTFIFRGPMLLLSIPLVFLVPTGKKKRGQQGTCRRMGVEEMNKVG